jgi:hypothetical protein
MLVFRGRNRYLAFLATAVPIALMWLPFVIADHRTLSSLGSFGLPVAPSTPLAVLGIHSIGDAGTWRLVQFAVELVAAVVVVQLGAWEATAVVVVTVRLLLDPLNFSYYSAGLLLCAIAFDLLMWHRPMPILTLIATGAFLSNSALLTTPESRAAVRIVTYTAVLTVAFIGIGIRRARRSADASVDTRRGVSFAWFARD